MKPDQSSPGEFEIRDQSGRLLGHFIPASAPASVEGEEGSFMEELRLRMESHEKPIPVDEFLAYIDALQKEPTVTPA